MDTSKTDLNEKNIIVSSPSERKRLKDTIHYTIHKRIRLVNRRNIRHGPLAVIAGADLDLARLSAAVRLLEKTLVFFQ